MPAPNVDSATLAAIREVAEYAKESREMFAHTRERTEHNGGAYVTQRVPLALLNRIRDLAAQLSIEVK